MTGPDTNTPYPDPDDPNYQNHDLLVKIQKMYEELPEGWSKGTMMKDDGSGGAPFVHVSGKVSWKHPARDKISKMVEEAQAEEKKAGKPWERGYNPQKGMIRRLRMMIQSGVPVAAVEQRARLEGIDISVLLADQDEATLEASKRGGSSSPKSPRKSWNKPKDPFKKYRLMIKNGISMGAVKQTAERDGVDPTEVEAVCRGTKDHPSTPTASEKTASASSSTTDAQKDLLKKYRAMVAKGVPLGAVKNQMMAIDGLDPSLLDQPEEASTKKDPLKKYRTMLKNGVPRGAVQNHMTIDGLDPALLDQPEGADIIKINKPKKSANDPGLKKYRKMLQLGAPASTVRSRLILEGFDPAVLGLEAAGEESVNKNPEGKKEEKAEEVSVTLFKPTGTNNVEFPSFPEKSPSALLAKLVRRMVQTVQKRASFQTGKNLVVDTRTLYNALGGFLGVQNQLEQYNRTFDDDRSHAGEDVRPLRKPFLELARNLGLTPDGVTTIPGLDELVDYVKANFSNDLDIIQSNLDLGQYDFNSLTQIYRPGTKVVAKNSVAGGVDMICQVEWNRYEEGRTLFGVTRYFQVCLVFCVAVGEHFTLAEVTHGMESFDGLRRLKDLQFVPLSAYTEQEVADMMSRFQQRGEKYSKVATGANFLAYERGSFFAKSTAKNSAAALATNGRIMVDTQGAYDFGHTLGVGYDPMIMAIKYKYKEYMLHMRSSKQQNQQSSPDDGMMLFDEVPKDYLEMTWPAVIGFSLTSKSWGDVLVDGLNEIDFQEKAFNDLVLPASRKRMVKALVRHSSDSFNDVISGKGEGSVFLLYGPPGVGKTLTAEAISEMLHKPLYSVSLGQLGTTPADLESKLGEILELCGKWDALILLDEADIFLEKRSSGGSLERNAMVSVMLRLVEYFKGVLFLTSNRVDSLDPAFKTRITLALRYDQLDSAARKQVWNNLLTASGQDLESFDTDQLAEHALNGREIKNAIRLGLALAADEGTPLTQDLVLETVDILNDFNEKLNSAEAY